MAFVKPFQSIRPQNALAHRVAALPYDVYNRKEAKEEILKEKLSFLNIDRPETQFGDEVDTYDPIVYQKAKELLDQMLAENVLIFDKEKCYYIYELVMGGRTQTGIVACASIDDYLNNVIKKHENTREEKEIDRINHVDICNAQTGPIFLAYRAQDTITEIVNQEKKEASLYSFTSSDGVKHSIWRVHEPELVGRLEKAFAMVDSIYIADGHHRAASAVKVGLKRRRENPQYDGTEEFNYFLSVLFPQNQLMILDYNRVVRDLNGHTTEEFLDALSMNFNVNSVDSGAFRPRSKGSFGMFIEDSWYELTAKEHILEQRDPVKALDVSILQDYILEPILGIKDPRIDERIDFVGGIRGLEELERRVSTDMTVAFSMYPTSIEELFDVSDAGLLMPPKSTWFEPKLRSGLFIHSLS